MNPIAYLDMLSQKLGWSISFRRPLGLARARVPAFRPGHALWDNLDNAKTRIMTGRNECSE